MADDGQTLYIISEEVNPEGENILHVSRCPLGDSLCIGPRRENGKPVACGLEDHPSETGSVGICRERLGLGVAGVFGGALPS